MARYIERAMRRTHTLENCFVSLTDSGTMGLVWLLLSLENLVHFAVACKNRTLVRFADARRRLKSGRASQYTDRQQAGYTTSELKGAMHCNDQYAVTAKAP